MEVGQGNSAAIISLAEWSDGNSVLLKFRQAVALLASLM
jgi:hypothetical protein